MILARHHRLPASFALALVSAVLIFSGELRARASGDTTPPTVAISAPSAGATVSGTVPVSANASDNVGVVGVQFKLDGTNLVAEDTASPYFISWNSAGASNGSHTLTAVARDAAGNTTTSAPVTITVSNSGPPAITSPGSALGTVGSPFSYQITATNNPTSFAAVGLPAGLSVNTATGLISGTPAAGGSSNSTIRATNAAGTGSASLVITTSASGGGGNAVTGYAWSDNIGWVSLDGPGYGLTVNSSSGLVSGYAWGDNVGWITSDATCGPQARVSGGTFSGWLHSLDTGGDGCISLSSSNGGSSYSFGVRAVPNTSYDPSVSGAWASDTIGWLAFNLSASLAPANCVMNSSPSVLYTQALPPSVTLSYTTQNANSASITANPSSSPAPGSVDPSGTSVSVAPPVVTTTYTMTTMTPLGTQYTCGTTIIVNSGYPPPQGCISIGVANPSCNAPVIRAKNIRTGDTAGLYWNVQNVNANSCSVTKNGASWLSAQSASNNGGVSTDVITQHTEYVLSCPAQDGTIFIDRATINSIPKFKEL